MYIIGKKPYEIVTKGDRKFSFEILEKTYKGSNYEFFQQANEP